MSLQHYNKRAANGIPGDVVKLNIFIFSRVSSKISEKYLSLRLCKVNNVQVVWKVIYFCPGRLVHAGECVVYMGMCMM